MNNLHHIVRDIPRHDVVLLPADVSDEMARTLMSACTAARISGTVLILSHLPAVASNNWEKSRTEFKEQLQLIYNNLWFKNFVK